MTPKKKKANSAAQPAPVVSPMNDELGGGPDLTAIRDQETLPVAREIFRILGEKAQELPMGTEMDEAAAAVFYQNLYVEIVPYLIKANIRLDDIHFLMQTVLQPVSLLQSVVVASFENNQDLAHAKLWGVKHLGDLRISHLDAVLREESGDKAE